MQTGFSCSQFFLIAIFNSWSREREASVPAALFGVLIYPAMLSAHVETVADVIAKRGGTEFSNVDGIYNVSLIGCSGYALYWLVKTVM